MKSEPREAGELVLVDSARLDRLIRALERMVVIQERLMQRAGNATARARSVPSGPTTTEHLEWVRNKRREWRNDT